MKVLQILYGLALGLILGLMNTAYAVNFHSEIRENETKLSSEAWGKAKTEIKTSIEIPRANLSKILTQQLFAISESRDIRQQALIQMISFHGQSIIGVDGTDPESLFGALDAQIGRENALGCISTKDQNCIMNEHGRTTWRELLLEVNITTLSLEAEQDDRRANGQNASCSKTENGTVLEKKCKASAEAMSNLMRFNERLPWVKAQNEYESANKALEQAANKAEELKKRITNDSKEISKNSSKDDTSLAKTSEAANELKNNLEKLISLKRSDVFHFELFSQTKLDALDAFLTTLSEAKSGTDPPATSPKAAMAVVLFSQFFDETKKTLKTTEDAGIAPILMEKEVARLESEAAMADINAKKAEVALLKQRANILREKFNLFVQAEDSRSQVTIETSKSKFESVLGKSLGEDELNQRMTLWICISQYLRSESLQASLHAVDLKRASAIRVSALAYHEANINAWQSLIDAHVNQLSAWSKAGIKGSDITTVLQTLAAWWIAIGVNK